MFATLTLNESDLCYILDAMEHHYEMCCDLGCDKKILDEMKSLLQVLRLAKLAVGGQNA